jgi:DnaJ-class molecular chaperone
MMTVTELPGFTPENCASCNGLGTGQDQQPCQPCRGKGRILVIQPSTPCPRCNGSGKPESGNFWAVDRCVVCQGTGWVWTEFLVDESSIRRAASVLIASGHVNPADG